MFPTGGNDPIASSDLPYTWASSKLGYHGHFLDAFIAMCVFKCGVLIAHMNISDH